MRTPEERNLTAGEATRWSRIGALCALAIVLGYVESFLPIPIPGVKLGLANIPVLVALAQGDLAGAGFVGMLKVLATNLLFGNPMAFAYSLVGTLLAFATMAPLSRLRTMRLEMVSVVGALAHEAGQLLVAQALLGTSLVWYSAPPLAVAGCLTGLLCGRVAVRTHQLLIETDLGGMGKGPSPAVEPEAFAVPDEYDTDRPASASADPSAASEHPATPAVPDTGTDRPVRTALLCLWYVTLVVSAMHTRTLAILAGCALTSALACLVAHVPARQLRRAVVPVVPMLLVATIAQVLSHQQGNVLLDFGAFSVTQEALRESATMLGRLVSICLASVALAQLLGSAGFARCIRTLTRPLRACGLRTEGPTQALATAFALLPVLVQSLDETHHRRSSLLDRLFWTEVLPHLSAQLYTQATERA